MNINNLYEAIPVEKYVTHWYHPVTRESIEAFLREQHKELKEECERLEKVAKFWQQKYYELNPPYTPPKIDNL